MKSILIFSVLLVLVTCPPSNFTMPGRNGRRESRAKEYKKEMTDCLLKSEISDKLKKQLEDKDKTLPLFVPFFGTKVDSNENDREIIRKCRTELLRKRREKSLGGLLSANSTIFDILRKRVQEKKNLK